MIRNLLAGGASVALSILMLFGDSPKRIKETPPIEIAKVKTTEELIESTTLYKRVEKLEVVLHTNNNENNIPKIIKDTSR